MKILLANVAVAEEEGKGAKFIKEVLVPSSTERRSEASA